MEREKPREQEQKPRDKLRSQPKDTQALALEGKRTELVRYQPGGDACADKFGNNARLVRNGSRRCGGGAQLVRIR